MSEQNQVTLEAFEKAVHDAATNAVKQELSEDATVEQIVESKIYKERFNRIFEEKGADLLSAIGDVQEGQRRAEHPDLGEAVMHGDVEVNRLNDLLRIPTRNSARLEEFQRQADRVSVLRALMGTPESRLPNLPDEGFRKTKAYKELQKLAAGLDKDLPAFNLAWDTQTSGEGAEWIPTEYSSRLTEAVEKRGNLKELHEELPMEKQTLIIMGQGSALTVYKTPEPTSDDPAPVRSSTGGTRNITLIAKDMNALTYWSEDMDEDSIIATLSYMETQMARAYRNAYDEAHLNGDTTSPHQDTAVTDADDNRTLWLGYRAAAFDYTGSLDNQIDASGGNISRSNILNAMKGMGEYGLDPDQLQLVVNPDTYIKLLALTQVETIDKFGTEATVKTGYIREIYGIPIRVTSLYRLTEASTGLDAGTGSLTSVALVYTPGFIAGVRKGLTLKTFPQVKYANIGMRATMRYDLQPVFDHTAESIVAVIFNLSTGALS